MSIPGVFHEYPTRLALRRAERDTLASLDSRLADVRLYVVIAAVLAAYLAFGRHWFTPWALLLFALAFAALMVRHERVAARLARALRQVVFYEQGTARQEDRWQGQGTAGTRFLDPEHPYAIDLDLFGAGSLFELLCTARTSLGEERLASWLLAPADPAALRDRQAAVAELAPLLDLREELALLGGDIRGKIQPGALAAWGETPARLPARNQRWIAGGLAAATVLAGAAWGLGLGAIPSMSALLWAASSTGPCAGRSSRSSATSKDLCAIWAYFPRCWPGWSARRSSRPASRNCSDPCASAATRLRLASPASRLWPAHWRSPKTSSSRSPPRSFCGPPTTPSPSRPGAQATARPCAAGWTPWASSRP